MAQFTIKKIEYLKQDPFTNLKGCTFLQFVEHLKNNPTERQKAIEQMISLAQSGTGLNYNYIPPLKQTGLECQTMALLNEYKVILVSKK